MSSFENQPQSSTFRTPRPIFLASKVRGKKRERLWNGLERFVNCSDEWRDFRALGRSFRRFWPVRVFNRRRISEGDIEFGYLDWHPACHRLFLFYRDTLRSVWRGDLSTEDWGQAEFLLGIKKWQKDVIGKEYIIPGLRDAWREISNYSQSQPDDGPEFGMLWRNGSFYIEPKNEFQQAFYLLFLQSWRARVCPGPGCKQKYFIARKAKQKFCGTPCSAGSRRASNRNWWDRVGAKRRAEQAKARSQRNPGQRRRQ